MQSPPARNITSKPPHKSPSVCVCVLHALIALAHHDAAQNADNEPTLWFPEGAIYTTYYMHQIEHVLLAGKGVNIKSHKLREKKKRTMSPEAVCWRNELKKYTFKATQFPSQQRTKACFDCEYTKFDLFNI